MTVPGEISILTVGAELHTCPSCGYELGFHTSFVSMNANKDDPVKSTREVYRVILICPECGARYDVGWRVSFAEFGSRFVKAPVNPPVVHEKTAVSCVPALPPHVTPPPE
jgi:hypothetical protein